MSNSKEGLFPRGSEWRKWDLHVHTPSSYDWDSGCRETAEDLVKKAIASNLSVIAITDHHIIEGIDEVLKAAKGKDITILPGVELRTDKGNKGIHIIGVFNSSTPSKTIYDKLLCPLNLSENDVKAKGDEHIYCNFEDACQKIHELGGLVLLHSGNKSSGIEQLDSDIRATLKKDLAFLVDIFEVSALKQVEDYRNIVFPRINQEFPCIITSDACDRSKLKYKGGHSTEVIGTKYSWIKADPTFEGLKQILYEPEPYERIIISDTNPTQYDHAVVDSFTVSDQNEKFFLKDVDVCHLNPGLNCIIGSRGSGKSAFLDAMGLTLGDMNVLKTDRNNYVGYFFKDNDSSILKASVKHSSTGNEEVLLPKTSRSSGFQFDYYHQKYIGFLADPNNEEILSRFLFDKIFQEDTDLGMIFDNLRSKQDNCRSKLAVNRQKVVACEQYIAKEQDVTEKIEDKRGRVKFLSKMAIKKLLDERSMVIKLKERMSQIRKRLEEIEDDPIVRDADSIDLEFFDHLILSDLDPEGTIIPDEWKELERSSKSIIASLDTDRNNLASKVDKLTDDARKLEPSFDFEGQLSSILGRIVEQSEKEHITISKTDLDKLDAIQKEIVGLENQLEQIQKTKGEKASLLEERRRLLKDYINYLDSVKQKLENNFALLLKGNASILKGTIQLDIETVLSEHTCMNSIQKHAKHDPDDDLLNFPNRKPLLTLFIALGHIKIIDAIRKSDFTDWNVRGLGERGLDYFRKIQNKEEVAMYLEELLPELTSRLLWRADTSREFKYLKNCSIGERGTALLSVILVTGKEPLIIDQPEDDLDHYFLYQTLTPIIKYVKKNRQLILATHDANIVINGDAEMIIIVSTSDGAFGTITATTIENLGTREKILEILEGGKDAFKQRLQKYGNMVN